MSVNLLYPIASKFFLVCSDNLMFSKFILVGYTIFFKRFQSLAPSKQLFFKCLFCLVDLLYAKWEVCECQCFNEPFLDKILKRFFKVLLERNLTVVDIFTSYYDLLIYYFFL